MSSITHSLIMANPSKFDAARTAALRAFEAAQSARLPRAQQYQSAIDAWRKFFPEASAEESAPEVISIVHAHSNFDLEHC